MDAKAALEKLMDGNRRFMGGKPMHPHQDMHRREEILGGQKPVAAVLTCSDSRVPPEILFDQGLGDIFVIRNAGNVVDDVVLGSLEYAVDHLQIPLILVLGHEKCGAVTAAAQTGSHHDGKTPVYIPRIMEKIAPAVERARSKSGDLIEEAARENAACIADEIRRALSLQTDESIESRVKVLAAYYKLTSGEVAVLAEI